MAEDYSEYVKRLRNLQAQKIADRTALRERLAATLAVAKDFADELHSSREVQEVSMSGIGSDAPTLVITPLPFHDSIHVKCLAENSNETGDGGVPTFSIRAGMGSTTRIEADLLADRLPFNHPRQTEQNQQRDAVFTAIIEGVAQLKADKVQPVKESQVSHPSKHYA